MTRSQSSFLRRPAIASLAALTVVMVGGCNVFDPGLYSQVQGAGGAGGGEGHGDDEIELMDACDTADITPLTEGVHEGRASLDGFEDNHNTLNSCALSDVYGPDGFFAVEALAGDRWHFAVEPEDTDTDLALYLMSGCHTESCMLPIDRCSAGVSEEFTTMFKQSGTYYIGVDSFGGAGDVTVTVEKPVCGDGEVEHGETCDDGNVTSADGCDPMCRAELAATESSLLEVEPNDWHAEANVIDFSGTSGVGTITLAGTIGGACDQDHFVLNMPTGGGSLRATMLDGATLPCNTSPKAMIMVMDAAVGKMLGMGMPGGPGGECPAVGDMPFANDLPEGEYHIMLISERESAPFDYRLQLDIMPPGT